MQCLPCGKRSTRDHMSRRSEKREVLRFEFADGCDRQVEVLVKKGLLSAYKARKGTWDAVLALTM